MAEQYMHGHHPSVLRSHTARTVENSAAYLAARLRPGLAVLDVGCGPGTLTVDLARLVVPGPVVGVDNASEILDVARAAARDRGAANVTFDVGDAYALTFPTAGFDVVHAHQLLQHLADPVAALQEMRRVCRPDGVVAARDSDYTSMTWYPSSPALDRWLEVYRAVAQSNGGEPDAGRRLLAWARSAGFSEVRPSASVWCFATPEDRAWWGGLWSERVVASRLAEHAVVRGFASTQELEAIAAAFVEWSASPDGWFAVLHGEVLCAP